MTSNTRFFRIRVNQTLFHSKPSTDKNIQSVELGKNIYFYMSKSYRIEQSRDAHIKFGQDMSKQIQNIIKTEAMQLQKFWYDHVNQYFDRRASHYNKWTKQGSWIRTTKRRNLHPSPSDKPSAMYNTTRQHTGQLRKALKIGRITPMAIELYVAPCSAKTNRRDYVEILVKGASPGPRAYIPDFDFRIKNGTWKGIPKSYWAMWQMAFLKQIEVAEKRANAKIEKLINNMGILHQKDLRAIRERSSRNKQYIAEMDELDENYSKQFDRKTFDESMERKANYWENYPIWEQIKQTNKEYAQNFRKNFKASRRVI
jgi:hypothetical protein